MLSTLRKHPFSVTAFFRQSLVITYAAPKEELSHLIPPCLQLDTYKDEWGFLAMALVQTERLRPAGWPEVLGSNFFLMGYRVFTRYKNQRGKNIRGLYILGSETDSLRMQFFGNIFTKYNYRKISVSQQSSDNMYAVRSDTNGVNVEVQKSREGGADIELPPTSPFSTWKEARRFAGPLPYTFTYTPSNNEILIIEGVRDNWNPRPVSIHFQSSPFFRNLNIQGLRLASGFLVENIPYTWKKAKKEIWTQ